MRHRVHRLELLGKRSDSGLTGTHIKLNVSDVAIGVKRYYWSLDVCHLDLLLISPRQGRFR
jgi:hypothetical protein